jgi:hypothetical protein
MDETRNNAKRTGKGKPPVEYQFKPGNPGRPKGSRNKLGESFIQDLQEKWEAQGAAVIDRVIKDRPHEFLKVIASILPKELKISNEADLSDDEILKQLRQLDALIRPFLGTEAAAGLGEGDESPAVTH